MLTDSRVSDLVHAKIREIAGQQAAAGIINRLRHQGVRYQFHVSLLPGRLAQGLGEHLGHHRRGHRGDPAKAEQLTRDHFASVIGCLHQLEERRPRSPSILLGPGLGRSGDCRQS